MKYDNFTPEKAEEMENERTIKLSFPRKNRQLDFFYEGPLPEEIVNEELEWHTPNKKRLTPKSDADLSRVYNGNSIIRDRINLRVCNRIDCKHNTKKDLKNLYLISQWGELVEEIVDFLKRAGRVEEDDEGQLFTRSVEEIVLRKVLEGGVEYENFQSLLRGIKPENLGEAKEIINKLKREDKVANREGVMSPAFLHDRPQIEPREDQQVLWELPISKVWLKVISRLEVCLDGEVVDRREGKTLSAGDSGKLKGKVDLLDTPRGEHNLSLVFKVTCQEKKEPMSREVNREIRVPPLLKIIRPPKHEKNFLEAEVREENINQIMESVAIQIDEDYINLKEDVDWISQGEKAFASLQTGSDINLRVENTNWPGWFEECSLKNYLEVAIKKAEKPGELFKCRVSIEDALKNLLETDLGEMIKLKVNGDTEEFKKVTGSSCLAEWEARKPNHSVVVEEDAETEINSVLKAKKFEIQFPEPSVVESPKEVQLGDVFQIEVEDKSNSGYELSENEIKVKSENKRFKIKEIERKKSRYSIELEPKNSGDGMVSVIFKVMDYSSESSSRIKIIEAKSKEEIRDMNKEEFKLYLDRLEKKINGNWNFSKT